MTRLFGLEYVKRTPRADRILTSFNVLILTNEVQGSAYVSVNAVETETALGTGFGSPASDVYFLHLFTFILRFFSISLFTTEWIFFICESDISSPSETLRL